MPHIQKLINLTDMSKKMKYFFYGENKYFMTHDMSILHSADKLLKNIPKEISLYDQDDSEIIDHINDNNTEIVTNKLYLMPDKKNILLGIKNNDKKSVKFFESWLIKLKLAKHYFNLDGVPYDWISNRGKLTIHRKALDLYLKNESRKLEVNNLLRQIQSEEAAKLLSNLPIAPTNRCS